MTATLDQLCKQAGLRYTAPPGLWEIRRGDSLVHAATTLREAKAFVTGVCWAKFDDATAEPKLDPLLEVCPCCHMTAAGQPLETEEVRFAFIEQDLRLFLCAHCRTEPRPYRSPEEWLRDGLGFPLVPQMVRRAISIAYEGVWP